MLFVQISFMPLLLASAGWREKSREKKRFKKKKKTLLKTKREIMGEVQPWYQRVQGPFPLKYGCVGVKDDGGGSMRGRGLVGPMKIHRAVFLRDKELIRKLVEVDKFDVNEVEAAGLLFV